MSIYQKKQIQIPNNKQYPMTKNTNSKYRSTNEYTNYLVLNIGILISYLFGIWCLYIGFCLKMNKNIF